METVRDLVLLAGKKWRVFSSGETPTTDELADGLSAFQMLIDELCVDWTDVDASAPHEAREDERIKTTSTVTLPTLVDDPDAENGERRPRLGAKVLVIDADGETLSLYRADKGAWFTASALTLESDLPIDAALHNVWADALAGRYCDLFTEPTMTQYRAGQRALSVLAMRMRKPSRREFF